MTITTIQNVDVLNTDVRTLLEQDESYIQLKQNIEKALEESAEIVIVTASDVNTASAYISNFKKISRQVESLRKQLVQPLTDKKAEIDSFFKSIPLTYDKELERLEQELLDFKRKQDAEAKAKADAERKRLEEEAIQKGIDEEARRKERQSKIDAIRESVSILAPEQKEERILWLCKTSYDLLPTQDEIAYMASITNAAPIANTAPVEPAIVPEVIPQATKISEMNASKVHTRKTKTFRIVNESLIPREYLMIDEKKIRAERNKYDACNLDGLLVKSTIPGVEFTFDESVV